MKSAGLGGVGAQGSSFFPSWGPLSLPLLLWRECLASLSIAWPVLGAARGQVGLAARELEDRKEIMGSFTPVAWKSMVQGRGTLGRPPSAQGKGSPGMSWKKKMITLCVGIW